MYLPSAVTSNARNEKLPFLVAVPHILNTRTEPLAEKHDVVAGVSPVCSHQRFVLDSSHS
jgi:hypothetical protein